MKRIKPLGMSLSLVSLLLIGCGGGGSSSNTPSSSSSNTGTFIDVPTKNLKYVTPTLSGYTDENGKYQYKDGEKVKFYLGDMLLGEVAGGEIVTPYTLAGDTNISNPSQKAKNIARLLQSLDSNQTDEDRILLPESVKTLNIDEFNISTLTENDMNTILTRANSNNSLVDETNATSKLKVYVENVLDTPQNKITTQLLTQNPWYVIEYDNNGTYCNGKFTYNNTDVTVEYIENGNNVSQNARYTLLNGKLITAHDGKVETETLSSNNNSSITVDKKAVDAVTGAFRNQMQKKWFINRQDALDFAQSRGKDCSPEM